MVAISSTNWDLKTPIIWRRLCSLILRAGTSEFNLCPGSSILWESRSQDRRFGDRTTMERWL